MALFAFGFVCGWVTFGAGEVAWWLYMDKLDRNE